MGLSLGQNVTDFSAVATGNNNVTLSGLSGRKVVLFFYPKDNTQGCTSEALAFKDRIDAFNAANTVVFGVSKDSLSSHESFKQQYGFPFELISDSEGELCELFDVIKEKKLYGNEYIGIERSTFLIDQAGILQHVWRKVRLKNHVEDVLQAAQVID